ncbi:hypothetical protein RHSIM_Rhsim01G0212500 [Rhododendron simsii]|uniref:GCF C-terminal domain-containing protein n=1 Tax=Rhododendron simsii TaxID=118357 RepID=A0A834LVX6_RHOSS|nr:hypothetical protein RHSIM_Rhsim01G0212500 [Rhododendron simsii]
MRLHLAVVGTSSNGVALPDVAQSIIPQQKYAYAPAVASYPSVPSIGGAVDGLPGLEVMSIPQQVELAKKALHGNLKRMKESHGRTMASLVRNDENLTTSLLKVTALEKSLSAAGERFIFMQKLRDFVSVIYDFLQHKAPFIEELEEQMQKINEDRAAAILKRRSSDNNDEMFALEAAINEYSIKTRKARSDAKRLSSMGSDGPYQQIEGESSTDESDSETAAYKSNHDLLLQTAEQVFSDTAEEYFQLAVVTERFDSWKKAYPSSYRDAYMSLSVPAIFSPYVRLKLLKWDPLHEDMDFNDMNWFVASTQQLSGDYLHFQWRLLLIADENDISPVDNDDDDANLVPQLVEKVAIPFLLHAIAHCWDMLSAHETRNAVLATKLIVRYVPASSESLIELVVVLHDRLADAVANLVVSYRFGRSVCLMRNICMWNKIIALPVLERLVLGDLLSGKVLLHLRSIQSNVHDAVTRTERPEIAATGGLFAETREDTAEKSMFRG